MTLKEVIGMNLKYYRYLSGKSQDKFYSDLHLNPKYLASVERGSENVSLDYIEELAKKLNVETNDLMHYNPSHVIVKKRVDEKKKISS